MENLVNSLESLCVAVAPTLSEADPVPVTCTSLLRTFGLALQLGVDVRPSRLVLGRSGRRMHCSSDGGLRLCWPGPHLTVSTMVKSLCTLYMYVEVEQVLIGQRDFVRE